MPLIAKELTREIIGAFYEVYNALGYGFLESVYVAALVQELRRRRLFVATEMPIDVYYKGERIAVQRLDLVVGAQVIVEVKSTRELPTIALRQLYSYLASTELQVGLLLHFGPRATFRRVVSSRRIQPRVARQRTEPITASAGAASRKSSG
ncbi:MAG: GxxExxY protein [Gemmatimonadales bacterium]